MQSVLIRRYVVPEAVRKQYAKYLVIELYNDRLIGKGGGNGDITYYFKNYVRVTWTPASLATQFAQIVFISHENASSYISGSNLNNLVDTNKIPFCSGMFSYEPANNYCKALYLDIKKAMDDFAEMQNNQVNAPSIVQPAFSVADELKKFKELLDLGIITQDEFNIKKNELLSGNAPIPQAPAQPQIAPPVAPPVQPQMAPPAMPAPQPPFEAPVAQFCPRCGTRQDQGGNFCGTCGMKLR